MCDKDFLKANVVLCKKCTHEARLCRNPRGGAIKTGEGAAVPFSCNSPWWVDKVCKHEGCNYFNIPVFFPEDEFKLLNPPCCCKQKMKPEKNWQGYIYRCEICGKETPLADLLPIFEQIAKN
jgi:hypothetical protein